MISSVDTNILLDILLPDTRFLDSSKELLKRAMVGLTPCSPGTGDFIKLTLRGWI
jgi:hypothetical protein